MSWYSILPPNLTSFESWIIRFFLFLGTLTIGPWAFLILYDILLYIWRATTYEIPVIGGRARGRRRPEKPSFSERPGGRRRGFSLRGTVGGDGEAEGEGNEVEKDGEGEGGGEVRRREGYGERDPGGRVMGL